MDIVSTSTAKVCKVCGQKAHGIHFGVVSCRACAAFFRRTVTSKWSTMKCRGEPCDQKKFFCKPCRLQKCQKMGMNTTKFQYNIATTAQFQLPSPSFASFVGRPEFLLFCDTDTINTKTLIDVRFLLEEADRILEQGTITPSWGTTQLKKLTHGFEFIKLDLQNLTFLGMTAQKETLEKWEFYFIRVTKWLMYFDEFQKLKRHLQMTLIQSIWHVFQKLHQHVNTMAYRRARTYAKPNHVIVRNGILDIDNANFDFTWMSDYPSRDVLRYLSVQSCYDLDIITALQELDPSETELTYLFAQLCFEYAGKRFQGDILKVTESFQKILSNDLHYYYVEELNMVRYSWRLAKLMKINNAIQKAIWSNRPKMELARVFNVLKIDFSHPEMFEDSGYY